MITSSSFQENKGGNGIYTSLQGQVIDGGLNCASGNEICDGVHFANHQCIPLSGTCHSSDI